MRAADQAIESLQGLTLSGSPVARVREGYTLKPFKDGRTGLPRVLDREEPPQRHGSKGYQSPTRRTITTLT